MLPGNSAPNLDVQRAFYDTYWAERSGKLNPHEIVRLQKIREAYELIRKDGSIADSPAICDLGCGVGWLSAELANLGSVTGVDLSPEGVRMASERWPHIQFVAADILSWRPGQEFDLVVSSEVMEHIPDKHRFADTIGSILRNRGYLILTTPNKPAKRGFFAAGHHPQVIEDWSSTRELRDLFAPNFEILRHETFVMDFAYTGIYRVTSAPKVLQGLTGLRLIGAYNALRRAAGMGLYQVLVAKRK